VNWAKARVGVVEHPAGSNQGPKITAWQEMSGYPGGGVPWCQCFVNASAYVGSRKRIKPIWFGGYTVSVVEQANNGDHGLKRISLEAARPGDWIYFNFPGGESVDHVGLFMHSNSDGTISTIEGNTSSGNSGSQSNGGGVFRRTRDRSLIAAVVRPPFKS
jgi:cell wall-associated NlpC family hydrolase